MQILLVSYNIDHLVVVVLLGSFEYASGVINKVDAGPISLPDDSFAKSLVALYQVYDAGTLRLLGNAFLLQDLLGSFHACTLNLRLFLNLL